MLCPKCGFETSDLAIYCPNCGAQIKVTCPECGANTQAGSAFCSQCGFHLASLKDPDIINQRKNNALPRISSDLIQHHVDPYERRTVTVLFVDIIGSTTFAENIDPEFVADIMRDAYPCLIEPIQAYKGSIVQVMGDGVLAYFGAPLAREDDPERAVLAGLKIVERIQSYAKKLRQDQVVDDFHVRVGINTGLVVVGELFPEKDVSYIALGDTVNLAARLQQNAPKDSVLISHATYQHIRGLFDAQHLGAIFVKGREQNVETYLVSKSKPDHLRMKQRGLEGVATTMIGREPEIAALQNIYRDAIRGGETAMVLVSGDPGIGKTRLINEFAGWVISQPISPIILRGRAIPGTRDVPYGVLRYLFARHFGILETDTTAKALEKFREGTKDYLETEQADLIGQFVGFDFKASPTIQPLLGSASFREISELYLKNYLGSLAEKSLLIIFEDLQWMDDRTLDFISELITEFSDQDRLQVMILCTARTKFFEARPKWGEGVLGFIKLKLRKLSRLQSRSLVDEILFKVDDIPEAFYECVVDEAGGNPFFVEEMIRMFFDEGVITTQDDLFSITLEKLEDLHVPSTLKGILQARLDSLPLPERHVVQRAAIIGRTFWDGLVKVMTGSKDEAQNVPQRLEALRDRNLIFHRERSSIAGNEEYLFKHALLRDAAYESVLLKHRRSYHQQVAKWIEDNAGDRLEEHLAMIAYHTMVGGKADLAADWYCRAGERALTQCSMKEAKSLFEKSLALINNQDVNRLWRATLGHDEAVGTLGELDARHADDAKLLQMAKQLKDDKMLAEAYYRVGSQANSEGNHQVAMRAFDHALDIAGRNKDLTMQALVLPLKISLLTSEGNLKEAGSLVENGLDLARKTEDADILARALNNIAPYYQAIGDISLSVALMQEQIDINQRQGNRLGETYGLINLGYFYLSLGQFTTAHRLLERALQIAQRLRVKICVAYSLLNLGLAEWRLGQPQKACEVLESSERILEALEDRRGLASLQYYLGLSYEAAGEFLKAAEHFISAIKSFQALEVTSGMVEAQAGLARLAIKERNITKAENITLQIINFLDQEGPQGLEFPILVYLTCVNVFDAVDDTVLVQHALEKGLKEIQHRLEMIRGEDWKEVFLEKIHENHLLLTYQKKFQ